ncbi:unnamed protein product, partial [Brassica rapa subsp. trilocularis]
RTVGRSPIPSFFSASVLHCRTNLDFGDSRSGQFNGGRCCYFLNPVGSRRFVTSLIFVND